MESEQMTVSERTPTTRGEYYFSLGWIRYYRYRTEQSRESAKTAAAPSLRVAASAVVRSRVENSIESGYGSRDRSWYQYFKGARSSIDRIFCIINRHSTPGTSTLTVHIAHVYTPHGYMYMHHHRDHYYCHPLPCLLSLPWPRVSGRMANLGDRIRATTAS